MEIELNKGKKTVIDDEDYLKVASYKWNAHYSSDVKNYYASTRINGKNISLHRLLMNASKGEIIDHIDRNPLNNSKSNLRRCTRSQNGANRTAKSNGTSKYLGVYFDKSKGKFKACLTINKKCITLGRFKDEKQAALKYNEGALLYHKEFANLNVI